MSYLVSTLEPWLMMLPPWLLMLLMLLLPQPPMVLILVCDGMVEHNRCCYLKESLLK